MRLYDAHNHMQDERLTPWRDQVFRQTSEIGVERIVVNGSCEDDWPQVQALARRYPQVIPSFGYHPWYVPERSPAWRQRLMQLLDEMPSAVGEIGLDRWILKPKKRSSKLTARKSSNVNGERSTSDFASAFEEQQQVFIWQLRLAAERNLPASIHCLQAWGALHEILRRERRPTCGFLLHSYGGPVEMVRPLADLGAYFSLPGYFAHQRKQRQRETFLHVPPDRLLIETDAPDQCLPDELNRFPLTDESSGKRLNHPANIAAVYEFAAELLGESRKSLADRVAENFQRLFGGIGRALLNQHVSGS